MKERYVKELKKETVIQIADIIGTGSAAWQALEKAKTLKNPKFYLGRDVIIVVEGFTEKEEKELLEQVI